MSMSELNPEMLRRVLIASANPLFAKGLEKLVTQHWQKRGAEIRLARRTEEATLLLDTWQPDLVIVDYDDAGRPGSIQREAFLSHFIEGDRPMQVMLVSLRASGEIVIYDRRALTPAQAEDWLDQPWNSSGAAENNNSSSTFSSPSAPSGWDENAVSQPKPRSGGMKHYVVPGVLTLIFTAILGFVLQNVGLLPSADSTQAGLVHSMINMQVWIISFLFSLIVVFMVYSMVVFRSRKGQEWKAAYFKSSTRLEVIWTVIPLGLVIFLSAIGARDLSTIHKPDPNALEVKVEAFQWGWLFQYPEAGVQSNQLYLPVDRQVHLVMTSRDVIHSFWVPEFGIKQDILPGANLVKELRITPNKIGDYKVYCNQLCGGAHAYMVAPVKVVSGPDFNAWLDSQSSDVSLSPAEMGAKLVQSSGCVGCHSTDGSNRVGPTWKGLAGSQVQLADGSTVTANDEYLVTSIVEPNKHIAHGFAPGLMPQNYKTQLSEQQVKAIVEFIKTLK